MRGSEETAAPPSQELFISVRVNEHVEICDMVQDDSGHIYANKCLHEQQQQQKTCC